MRNVMAVAVVAAVLSGCSGMNSGVSHGQVANTWNDASDSKTLRFRGLGTSPATATSTTQRMGLSRQAAQADARAQATAYLRGLRVKGDIEVKDAVLKNSNIQGLIDHVIAGLVEERTQWLDDGGCLVVMSIDRSQVDQMIARTQEYEAGLTTAGVR